MDLLPFPFLILCPNELIQPKYMAIGAFSPISDSRKLNKYTFIRSRKWNILCTTDYINNVKLAGIRKEIFLPLQVYHSFHTCKNKKQYRLYT